MVEISVFDRRMEREALVEFASERIRGGADLILLGEERLPDPELTARILESVPDGTCVVIGGETRDGNVKKAVMALVARRMAEYPDWGPRAMELLERVAERGVRDERRLVVLLNLPPEAIERLARLPEGSVQVFATVAADARLDSECRWAIWSDVSRRRMVFVQTVGTFDEYREMLRRHTFR